MRRLCRRVGGAGTSRVPLVAAVVDRIRLCPRDSYRPHTVVAGETSLPYVPAGGSFEPHSAGRVSSNLPPGFAINREITSSRAAAATPFPAPEGS
jgi:hypothetical protein